MPESAKVRLQQPINIRVLMSIKAELQENLKITLTAPGILQELKKNSAQCV